MQKRSSCLGVGAFTAPVGLTGLTAFGTTGCGPGEPASTPSVDANDVRREVSETGRTAAEFAADQRREMSQRASGLVNAVETELEAARATAAQLAANARARIDKALTRAAEARTKLVREAEALQAATRESYTTTQQRLTTALDEMAEARREVAAALLEGKRRSGSGHAS